MNEPRAARPDASPSPSPSLADVVAEFVDRRLAGELLGVEDVCARHPSLAAVLRDRLLAFERLSDLADDDAPPLCIGDIHGDYRIEELLGRGGMAYVYRATQLSLDRPVAVKVGFHLALDQALVREARAIARLRHPHVVALLAFEQLGAHGALIMQYVEGESLSARLRRGEIDPYRCIFAAGGALASAVQAMHDAGVMHRDIKPANVLIGRDGTPYLADFGLARWLRDDASASAADAGTPAYMSPEQIRGEPATAASDLFALGMTLYEWLTGQSVRSATTRSDLHHWPRGGLAHASVRHARPELPRATDVMLAGCLAPHAENRYATAAALAADLHALAQGRPIARAAGSPWLALGCGLERWRTRLAIGAAFVVLLALALWWRRDLALQQSDTLLARAELLIERAQYQDAIDMLESAPPAQADRGRTAYLGADAMLQQAAALHSALSPAFLRVVLGHLDSAERQGFDSAGLHLARAFVLGFLGRRAEAKAALERGEREPHVTASDFLHRAGMEALQRHGELAVANYREALRRQPRSLLCYMQLASWLQATGHADEGLQVLDQGERIYPDSAELIGVRGSILAHSGKPAEGLALLARVVERRPAPWLAVDHLRELYREQERYDDLLALFEGLSEDEPRVERWQFARTEALFLVGYTDEGAACVDDLLKRWPDDLLARALRVVVQLGAGEVREATAAVRQIATGDGSPWALMAIADLTARMGLDRAAQNQGFFAVLRALLNGS